MKNVIKIFAVLFVISWITPSFAKDKQTKTVAQQNVTKSFLYSIEGTYGWWTGAGDNSLSYDFFPNGGLHIQGADGEATMWEGTWKLVGNKLTLKNKDLKTSTTVTVSKDGDELLLDGKRYRRYQQ